MSMKLRLSLIFGFFTLSICVLTLVGYYGSSQLATSLSNVANTQMPALKLAGEIDMRHDGLRAVVLDGFHSAAVDNGAAVLEYQQELNEMSASAFEAFDAIEKMDLPKDTMSALKLARPAFEEYVKNGKKVFQFLAENRKGQVEEVLADFKKQFEVLEKDLGEFTELIQRDAKAINMDGTNTPFFILNISLGALLLGLLTAIGSVYTLSSQLQRAYREINSVSKGVSSSGSELSSASHQLAAASQEQASSTEETSSSLEEISGMVASSLKSSEQSVNLSSKVFEMVRSGTDSMSELQKAVNEIADANDRVDRLAKLIEEIGEKTELIDEIVFQTRLLSFNASVEAERAGEHGRGFAVVAQEVGNLAQMSGKSASEITQIVKKSIKEAHEVVQVNKSKVELGVNLCKKTYQQLQSIEGLSNEISGNAENILRSSEEQNSGVQQINQAIQLISQATQQNTSLAMEVSTNSARLEKEAHKLQIVVGNLESMVFGRRSRNVGSSDSIDQDSHDSEEGSKSFEGKGEGPFASSPVGHNVRTFPGKKSHAANGSAALKNSDDPWEKL